MTPVFIDILNDSSNMVTINACLICKIEKDGKFYEITMVNNEKIKTSNGPEIIKGYVKDALKKD